MFTDAREKATTSTYTELLRNVDSDSPCHLDRSTQSLPEWPSGYVGSFTNKRAVVLGALLNKQNVETIGIDLELYEHAGDKLDHTARDGEAPPTLRPKTSILGAFSVKEAAFKAYFQIYERVLDFDAIRLSWASSTESYDEGRAECPDSLTLNVQCVSVGDWIVSTAQGSNKEL